jgi:hypothetical protein
MFDSNLELRINITPSRISYGRFYASEITFEMLSFIDDYINGIPFIRYGVNSRSPMNSSAICDNHIFVCNLWTYDDSSGFNLAFENFKIGQIADEEGENIFEFFKNMDGIEINYEPRKPPWPVKHSPEYLSLTIPFNKL